MHAEDPDTANWLADLDPDLAAALREDLAAEAELSDPPKGASQRVLAGVMGSLGLPFADPGLSIPAPTGPALDPGLGAALTSAGTGAAGTGAAGTGAAGTGAAGTGAAGTGAAGTGALSTSSLGTGALSTGSLATGATGAAGLGAAGLSAGLAGSAGVAAGAAAGLATGAVAVGLKILGFTAALGLMATGVWQASTTAPDSPPLTQVTTQVMVPKPAVTLVTPTTRPPQAHGLAAATSPTPAALADSEFAPVAEAEGASAAKDPGPSALAPLAANLNQVNDLQPAEATTSVALATPTGHPPTDRNLPRASGETSRVPSREAPSALGTRPTAKPAARSRRRDLPVVRAAADAPLAPASGGPPAPNVDLRMQAEHALLEAARRSLQRGDLEDAGRLLATHQTDFGIRSAAPGQLREDADYLRVRAAWKLGDPQALADTTLRFLANWPRSIYGPAVLRLRDTQH